MAEFLPTFKKVATAFPSVGLQFLGIDYVIFSDVYPDIIDFNCSGLVLFKDYKNDCTLDKNLRDTIALAVDTDESMAEKMQNFILANT
eukprot:UN09001